MENKVIIRKALANDITFLPAIESAASALFREYGFNSAAINDTTTLEEFAAAQKEGLLWIAEIPHKKPVSYALLELLDENVHLSEVDVHLDYGRKGIGTALVQRVCRWAKESGFERITLTTYKNVPWNAPFYKKIGFTEMPSAEYTSAISEIVKNEDELGLYKEDRWVMVFKIK